jgi:G3E family GTPase
MRRRRGEIAGFDRVIVETSGIADPGPVAQTLFADEALARDYRVGRVLTVVDAADAGGRRAAPQIAAAQIAAADLVVFSKSDRTTPQDLQAARAEVHAINPGAATVVAEFGDIDPQALADEKSGTGSDYSRFAAAAQHPGSIGSFALEFPAPVPRKSLDQFLGVLVDLRGADLLRVKGAVHLEGGERVLVQGVRHVFDRMRRLPAGSALPSALVFITNNVPKAEVEDLWRAIQKLGARQ